MRTRFPCHRRSRRLVGWPAAVALLAFAGVPVAAGAPSTPGVAPVATPTTATSATFSWSAASPDLGYQIVRYEGGLGGELADFGLAQSAARALPEGTQTFRVRAVQEAIPLGPLDPPFPVQDPTGPFGTVSVVVNRTPPTLSVGLSPSSPNGSNGWYRSAVTIDWSCGDAGSGIAACPPDEAVTSQGAGPRRTGQARDAVGLLSPARTSPAFNLDSVPPAAGAMRTPSPGATVAPNPEFVWGRASGSDTSGFQQYELMVRVGGRYQAIARISHDGRSEYRTRRQFGPALPNNTELRWYVRTYDRAGNVGGSESQSRSFRIDPTVPGPPVFTAGPSGPTNVAGPVFAWSGSHPSFSWEVSAAGTESVLATGSGPQTQALLPPLPDGDYTFSVSQVTSFGAKGVEATRTFQIDTVAPPAPVITGRPPFPSPRANPTFAWAVEPGAYSRWRVVGAAGTALQSSDTPVTTATVGPLAAGAYSFRVSQVDPAGNESAAAVEPFSIVGAGPAATRRGALALPRQNAGRLRPKAGKTLYTRRPILRWRGGPPGVTVYNLQVFRVAQARTAAGRAPAAKKIYSVFPNKRRYKMPARKIQPGTCYVWRVWPFVGRRFTGSPLGVSNFCIASAKAIKRAEARRRAKRG